MARYGSADVHALLAGGYDLRGDLTELSVTAKAVTEDVTVLGDSWRQYASVGLAEATVEQAGFYSTDLDTAVQALHGSRSVMCLAAQGSGIGAPVLCAAGQILTEYSRAVSRGELHKAKLSIQVTGALREGRLLHALGAETAASGSGSSYDGGASSTAGGTGYLQLTALNLDGGTSLTVRIQHSADGSTWADLVTFTAAASAPAAEAIEVTGTVERYLRVTWTFTGTSGTNRSATFLVAFARH